MIEAHAFLAAFTVQLFVTSVLYPAWFIRYARVQMTSIPAERLPQLFPGVDLNLATERLLTRYRALTTGIAVLGLLLLGWLFSYMQRPNWDVVLVTILATVHFVAMYMLPFLCFAWALVRFYSEHKQPLPEVKRTAVLQRRGLFDFVSPFIVFVAVLGYVLFAAFVIYIQQRGSAGFSGYVALGAVTLTYALDALVVYMTLYGRKSNPFETHAGRLHSIGLKVKSNVYGSIVVVAFMSLMVSLGLLDLESWVPFATSVFLVVTALLTSSMGFAAPLRKPDVDGLGSTPAS